MLARERRRQTRWAAAIGLVAIEQCWANAPHRSTAAAPSTRSSSRGAGDDRGDAVEHRVGIGHAPADGVERTRPVARSCRSVTMHRHSLHEALGSAVVGGRHGLAAVAGSCAVWCWTRCRGVCRRLAQLPRANRAQPRRAARAAAGRRCPPDEDAHAPSRSGRGHRSRDQRVPTSRRRPMPPDRWSLSSRHRGAMARRISRGFDWSSCSGWPRRRRDAGCF